MKAIILAAGIGKRLQKVSGGLPKSMIEIGGKSIIHRQLESCLEVGINDFVFVLGFKKEILQNHILELVKPENCTFVYNPIFDKTNTLYSLWLARKYFDDDFIYFNADVVFKSELLAKISGKSKYSQLLLETKHCGEEEVKMIIDKENRILEIGKKLEIEKCAGEFIGVGKFNLDVLPDFAHFLQVGIDNGQENNYFEY
ncbi:MAG: hypothetical protein DRZ79_06195, partial [Candidatus Cloacimonadota bacterium]